MNHKLQYFKGDLISLARNGHFDVIIHGCNCFCTMGAGIAAQISKEYPGAYEADLLTTRGDITKLGTYTKFKTDDGFTIINAYTQHGLRGWGGNNGDVFEYDSFEKILNTLADEFNTPTNFGFPYIGMGLAGGDSVRIVKLIEDFANNVDSSGGTVTLVEYKNDR